MSKELLKDAEYLIQVFENGCDPNEYWRDISDWREEYEKLQAAKPADALGSLPVVSEFRGDGMDCTCMARSSSECACDADWTPKEIYQLRADIQQLRRELELHGEANANLEQEILALRAKLGAADGLVEALEFVSNCDLASQESGNRGLALYEAGNVARLALTRYQAAQKERKEKVQ